MPCPSSRRTTCASSRATTSKRTRRAFASRRASRSTIQAERARYSEEQYLRSPAEMSELFADLPEAHREHRRDRETLLARGRRRQGVSARLRRRGSHAAARAPRAPCRGAGSSNGCVELGLRPDAAPRYRERLAREIEVICKMGFEGYFLIVADFIAWARAQRHSRRARPRLGRRLARRLCARHHESRPARARSSVRAVLEPRARVAAGLRHRLLHRRPRSRHRLRGPALRPRASGADRDLRHDGRARRRARRRPRARACRTATWTGSRS